MELITIIGLIIILVKIFSGKKEKFWNGYHGIDENDTESPTLNTKHRRVRIKDGVDYSLGHFDGKHEELEVEVLDSGEVIARRVSK